MDEVMQDLFTEDILGRIFIIWIIGASLTFILDIDDHDWNNKIFWPIYWCFQFLKFLKKMWKELKDE